MSNIIYITTEARAKLQLYITAAEGEVSGLGQVVREDNKLIVTDIFLLDQNCSASSTTITEEGLAKFMVECVQKDMDTSTIRLWWHSHADMSVFWSNTDQKTIKELAGDFPWMLSIVGNKAGEYLTRLDITDPVIVSLDKLPLSVFIPTDKELEKQIQRELKEKVTAIKTRTKGYFYPYSNPVWKKGGKSKSRSYNYDRDFYTPEEDLDDPYEGFTDCLFDDVSEDPETVNRATIKELAKRAGLIT